MAQVNVGREADISGMNFQNRLAADNVRPVHYHRAVKTSGAQQGRIECFRPIGSRHDNHAAVGIKTVHFHEELVEGLLALIVAAD